MFAFIGHASPVASRVALLEVPVNGVDEVIGVPGCLVSPFDHCQLLVFVHALFLAELNYLRGELSKFSDSFDLCYEVVFVLGRMSCLGPRVNTLDAVAKVFSVLRPYKGIENID